MNQHQDDWDEWLSIAEFTYNDWVHALTQSSPFMLNTRQHPQLSVELLRESCLETLNDFASRMGKAMDEAHSALTQAADNMA